MIELIILPFSQHFLCKNIQKKKEKKLFCIISQSIMLCKYHKSSLETGKLNMTPCEYFMIYYLWIVSLIIELLSVHFRFSMDKNVTFSLIPFIFILMQNVIFLITLFMAFLLFWFTLSSDPMCYLSFKQFLERKVLRQNRSYCQKIWFSV